MITIFINGKKIELEGPVTVLEAARKNGIDIPTLCNHPALELWGGCRMCVVEIEKMPRLQTSCTVTAADGMTIYTETPRVIAARKSVLEFLLINHPLQCPTCDKAGVCKLQDLTVKYGAVAGRFEEGKRTFPESVDDPIIVRNMERCIMCTRCVRMCDGVQGAFAIGVVNRGSRSHVEPFSGGRYNCEYCGNCLNVCPVGAIMSRLHRYTYRPWQMEKTVKTICSFCGVGCTLQLEIRSEAIQKVSPVFGAGVNNGLLCGRGMFGYGYVESPERLKTPLIRKNGRLEPAGWDEALALTASKLLEIKGKFGGSAIAGIAGSRCTNEENFIFQKLLRAGFGSNNIDSVARLGLLHAQNILEEIFGQGAAANLISGIPHSDAVLTVGCDPTQTNPVMGLQVRAAAKAGKRVITVGHARGLRRHRTHSLPARFGTEGILVSGLLSELLKIKKLPGENPELEAAIKNFKLPALEEVELLTGVSPAAISEAASALKEVSTSSVIAGRELAASMDARRNFILLAAIGYILNSRFFLISERPNEQGLIDMGCAPDVLPGDRPLSLQTFRESYEEEWGVKLDPEPGLTLMEMFERAGDSIRAMYIMGENPAFNLPGRKTIKQGLEKLDFLVVQDIFMTETAAMADVVFPSLAWSEKEGTYTNVEKRIQKLEKCVEKSRKTQPGNDMPKKDMEDWKILAEIGKRTGLNMSYAASSDIIDEIGRVSALHAGLGYGDLAENGMMWPYKGKPLRMGGRIASIPEMGVLPEMTAAMHSTGQVSAPVLIIDKPLFHSGTLSRHAGALLDIMSAAEAKMSPETGTALGVPDGGTLKVSTAEGEMMLKVKLEEGLPMGVIFASNNFGEAGALGLFGYELEPESKTPVLKLADLKFS